MVSCCRSKKVVWSKALFGDVHLLPTDQCLVWNLQWSRAGKEDFSEGLDVFQSVMSVKLVKKTGFHKNRPTCLLQAAKGLFGSSRRTFSIGRLSPNNTFISLRLLVKVAPPLRKSLGVSKTVAL